MKKYLITGFSGFVSQYFIEYLDNLEVPCEVLGVDINAPKFLFDKHKNIKCHFKYLNLLERADVDTLISEFTPDYILHLASYSSVASSWKNPVTSFVNNTNIFLNVVECVRLLNHNCKILSIGSSEEYGIVKQEDLPLKETLHPNPISPYAVARVSQEMLSDIYANSYNLNIVLTRSFNHIGPGQSDVFVISSFAKKLVEIKKGISANKKIVVGNLDIIRDFLDVRDVVEAYYLLLNNGVKGALYNICSGSGTSLFNVLQMMMDILEIEVEIEVDSNLIRPADNSIIIGSNEKIKRDLSWSPKVPLKKSLYDVLKYWEDTLI
jgi:GDP-4-dehydro-6-deoxy-D-mannose reductase